MLWYVYENQYKATVEENEKLRKDIKLYEATITNLDNAKLNEEKYKTETEKIKAEVAEMLSAFPVEIRIEDELLYVEYLEEQLKYDISMSSATIAHITSKGDNLIGTSLGYGSVDVTVVAKDARGEKVTFTFKVTVKDPSDPLSLYPNPVKDFLNVATLDLADTEIVISSSTGKVMFHDVMKVSAQDPARIDMSSYVPGTYSVQVRFGGKEYKKNVVKL